jgi:hypothetical protein
VAHRRVLAEVRPDGRQPLVGPAAEEQRVGQDQLLEAGIAAVGVELEPLLGCGRLEGAVDGDLVVDDDVSHAGEARTRSGTSASVERLALSRLAPGVRVLIGRADPARPVV